MSHVSKQRGRRFASTLLAFVTILSSAVGNTLLTMVPVAHAASSVVISSNGLPNGFWPNAPLKASSAATPIVKIGITASSASQTFNSLSIHFSGNGFITSDLAATGTDATSGVALFVDTNTNHVFDSGVDANVTLTNGTSGWQNGTSTFVFVPAVPVSLTSGMEKIFFVAIKTSATISNLDRIAAEVYANSVMTSDGNGPSAAFVSPAYQADTVAPTIVSSNGFQGSTDISIRFGEPVARVNLQGGSPTSSLVLAAAPITYWDGGGASSSTIANIQHMMGSDLVTVTLNSALDAADLDGTPATVAASTTVSDMAGNIASIVAFPLASQLGIITSVFPSTVAAAVFADGAPLVTLSAQGGAGGYVWSYGNAETSSTMSTLGFGLNGATGAVTGTVANLSGSFNALIRVSDSGGTSTTRMFTINVAPSGGGSIPGITTVSPPGAARGAVGQIVNITGAHTSFTNASVVQLSMPEGVPGTNGITINSASSSGATALSISITVDAGAATGSRNLRVTTGAQIVSMPNAFSVFEAAGAGLNILFPLENATDVPMPPGITFSHGASQTILSYRVSVKTSSDPGNTLPAIWDYAFPKTTDNSGHCGSSQCSMNYGAGLYRLITQPSPLAPNTDYYVQVRSYAADVASITSSTIPVDTTAQRRFRTVTSITDTTPPTIYHRPISRATASANLNVFARMNDNVANASTTPALIVNLFYCQGSACTPTTQVTGTRVADDFYRFIIPSGTIGVAGTITRYYLLASDGSNVTRFRQPDSSPFSITSAAAGTNETTGFVRDGTDMRLGCERCGCICGRHGF